MKTTFTPGPWHFTFVNDRNNEGHWQIDSLTGTEEFRDRHFTPDICSVHVHAPNEAARGIAKDNARLIAAAPDLLAACELALVKMPSEVFHGECIAIAKTLRSAISKAKGTS